VVSDCLYVQDAMYSSYISILLVVVTHCCLHSRYQQAEIGGAGTSRHQLLTIDLGLNRGHAQILLTRPHAHRRPGDSVQDPKAFASLLQSWLYHAMLHEVLGFQFDLDDLYYQAGSGDRILTVARSRQVCIYVVEALLIACYLPG
jgi:hypothetical protein